MQLKIFHSQWAHSREKLGVVGEKWGDETIKIFLNRHCIMYSSNNNDDDDDYVTLHGVHSSCIEMHFGKFSRECMLKKIK